MTLAASVTVSVVSTLTGAPDVGTAVAEIADKLRLTLTDGTGANQANAIYTDDWAIVGAGSQTYDLAGTLTDSLGATKVFTAIKALIIINNGTTACTYGNGTAPFAGWVGAATDTISIPAGGFIVLTDPTAAGQAVAAGTADGIKLAGTDISGTIYVIGEA